MKIVFAKFFYCWFISDAHCSKLIHFIVDSRSDVETSSESWKAELQLAYLHNVESRGAHSAADRPLFKGVIKLDVKKMFFGGG